MPGRKRKTQEDPETVRLVERTCDILFAFSSTSPSLSLLEIARAADLPKTTAYRILRTLEVKGLVQQDEKSQEFSLGFKVFQLGSIVINHMDLRKIAMPYMLEIASCTGEAVSLNIVQDQSRVCIERVESQGIIRYYLPIGARSPLYLGATGKVLMAYLPGDEIEQVISSKIVNNPEACNIDVDRLKRELDEIRDRGYACTKDELGVGVTTVAAPVFGFPGSPAACINISGPVSRFTADKVAEYTGLLVEAARKISKLAGGKP